MRKSKRLILASASPRRYELLKALGFEFDVISPDVDESESGDVISIVKTLAHKKAAAVSETLNDALVVAADTLVSIDGKILGKPESREHAYEMLRLLSGRAHEVLTGICLMDADTHKFDLRAEISRVRFRDLTDDEIYAYIATGEPMDKAGAYAIQGLAKVFVEGYDGSYENIIGFPSDLFIEMYNGFVI